MFAKISDILEITALEIKSSAEVEQYSTVRSGSIFARIEIELVHMEMGSGNSAVIIFGFLALFSLSIRNEFGFMNNY